MAVYRIADLNILIEPIYVCTASRLKPYITSDKEYDFEIKITKDALNNYCAQSINQIPPKLAESSFILSELCNTVLERYDGFFFHSSSLMLDGEAYVFSAVSGTGKSTHTALWRRHFGDKVKMINDDKPIVRKKGDKFYIYGTPWMGKADIGNNISAPVKAVYILQRGIENSAKRIKTGEVFKQIFEATVVPTDKTKMEKLLTLLDEFFTSTSLFLLTCNLDEDAAQTAYNAANSDNSKEV